MAATEYLPKPSVACVGHIDRGLPDAWHLDFGTSLA